MRLASRYNGPPDSANGGVTAGRLAAYVGAPAVRVTLRRPPPLDVDLRVDASGGRARLYDGDVLVAEADPSVVDVEPGPAVTVAQAAEASAAYPGYVRHPYPTCWVCGTEREDGLGLRPGPLDDGRVACVWTPQQDDPVEAWAALDCPGGWAADRPGRPIVLGRITLERRGPLRTGEPHVVMGWTTGEQGRKTFTGTSLHSADGDLLAVAQATWIALP